MDALLKVLAAEDVGEVGVAYSGGADSSAVLLAAAQQWPGRVQAFHVNHGMQAAAAAFEQHATVFCAEHGIRLHVARLQVQPAPGESPEDAARKARYTAIANLADVQGIQHVLLAQHADDQAETVLLALSRGAGLPGLAAMPARFERAGLSWHRPILAVPGQALRDWLVAQQVPFVTDPSNANEALTRNRIRHQLLPVLERAFPAFRQTLARSARHAAQAQRLLVQLAEEDAGRTGLPPRIKDLQALSPERQANLLRHWLKTAHQAAASAAQLDELLKQVQACTTRGHRIHLKIASGSVQRTGQMLSYSPNPSPV